MALPKAGVYHKIRMRGAPRRVLHTSRGRILSSRSEATLAMPLPVLSLLFVRHGETTANRDGVLQGHQNYNLTNLGERQAKVTGERLSRKRFWQAHSSDLVRASRTAEIIVQAHPGLELRTSPLLREFSLGVLEDLPRGTSREEALRIKAKKAGVPVEEFQAPRSEKKADVERRAQQFLDSLLDEARRGRTHDTAERSVPEGNPGTEDEVPVALIVSHGGFIHTMLSRVLGLGNEVPLPSNCSISVVNVHERGTGDGQEDGTRGGVSYVPQVLDDNAHMVEADLAVVNRVENLDVR